MFFNVHGNIWKIQFANPNSKELLRSDGSSTFGVTDNSVKKIFIADNLSDEMTERVLCHEITHVICFENNISIPLETEEWLCNFMADHGKEIIYLLDDILRIILTEVA